MPTIERLSALEILDSRGRPTVSTTCRLAGGAVGSASVPSGASTGTAEAVELRDNHPQRYGGLGCRKAVGHVNRDLHHGLAGQSFATQAALDQALIELDGTANKSRLGANAVLSVSLAFARATSAERGLPLYRHFSDVLGETLRQLPRLTVNLFSGGKHAGQQVSIQDVLVVPVSAESVDEGLSMVYAVYQAAAGLVRQRYGMRALTADEGGLAPAFASNQAMLEDAVAAIRTAGLEPGSDVALAVDVASTHFFHEGCYHLGDQALDSRRMIAHLEGWARQFPIVSIEDGLAEDDWANWPLLRQHLPEGVLVLGDDFLCTNPARIRRAIDAVAADALLLKVNQVGTLSEAAEACRLARSAGWAVTVSARSGETEDHWLADLAVGWAGDQIKVGSITQSERLAKYNRLLAIEAETHLPVTAWPAGRPGDAA
jgi:enolase